MIDYPEAIEHTNISNAPKWKNNRWINDLTAALSLTDGIWNPFSNFLNTIGEKVSEEKLKPNWDSENIKILDIWCGQGKLIEDIIKHYDITWIGVSKYNERDDDKSEKKWIYIQQELSDTLPNEIADNSIDSIISLYSLQYIAKWPSLIADSYKKLKIWWKALISLWTFNHIDPLFLKNIEELNKDIIIQSVFNGNIAQEKLNWIYNAMPDGEEKNLTYEYMRYSYPTHFLYIEKKEGIDEFIIPPYESRKDIRVQYPKNRQINNDRYDYLNKHWDTTIVNHNLLSKSYTFVSPRPKRRPSRNAFTLLEMLIVIMIIAVLSLVSLQLNRWQIDDMRAMNEREQRLSRHRKHNTLTTNTNYINNIKSDSVTFEYTTTGVMMTSSGWQSSFWFGLHTLSGWDLTLTKKTLSLWCEASQTTLELIGPNKTACFTLNTHLCSRSPCTSN